MSHLDYISVLPKGWELKPVRAVSAYGLSSVDKHSHDDEIPVRLCNYTDVYKNEFIDLSLPLMAATASESEVAYARLEVGDVLLTKDSESWDDIGIPALVTETAPDVLCGYHLAMIRPVPETLIGEFLFRCLQSKPVRTQLELAATGVTRFGVPKDAIGSLRIPLPPLPVQRAIADFLDRETAEIDALIAAKERLLGIMAEKRRALIAHAVTRGLDPDAPMKDSGVAWLGEIPAHWEAVPLRFLVSFFSGGTPDMGEPRYWGEDIPWVSAKDMKRDELFDAEDHITEAALKETTLKLIPVGALLLVVRGMILAHSIPVAISRRPLTINQDLKALLCSGRVAPEYLQMFFWACTNWLVSLAGESAHGTRKLETEMLGRLEVTLPPLAEQEAIVAHVASATSKLDRLRAATERTISLLKERRAALIAEAVTGKLEVAG